MDFKNLSLIELKELIDSGKTSTEEICTYFEERIKKYNDELQAFNTLPEGQKNGLPIAVKDIFCEV